MNVEVPASLKKYASALAEYYRKHFPAAAAMAGPCFLNTIETTVKIGAEGHFVITGDIPAMWLRDSAAQLYNYLPFAKEDAKVRQILCSAIETMAKNVCRDPYANAFNQSANGQGAKDHTLRSPWVWERKYETDSLCAPIRFGWQYWKTSHDTSIFTDEYHSMLQAIIDTFICEQDHAVSPYSFERDHCPASDTLCNHGKGAPVSYTGMTWSGFRPSDDACRYGFLVPANAMAAVVLGYADEMLATHYHDDALAQKSRCLRLEIMEGIRHHGIVSAPDGSAIYAYEVDGQGHSLLMDDANVPSLLSLPYLGFCSPDDALYRSTRQFLLSKKNPYFYTGEYASGIGSPHTPDGYIWPIGIIMQALTSTDHDEITSCLNAILRTDAQTGWIHESFDPNEPAHFTRSWFAWANSLFATLLIHLKDTDFFE